jgi:hypothetical protein
MSEVMPSQGLSDAEAARVGRPRLTFAIKKARLVGPFWIQYG